MNQPHLVQTLMTEEISQTKKNSWFPSPSFILLCYQLLSLQVVKYEHHRDGTIMFVSPELLDG